MSQGPKARVPGASRNILPSQTSHANFPLGGCEVGPKEHRQPNQWGEVRVELFKLDSSCIYILA